MMCVYARHVGFVKTFHQASPVDSPIAADDAMTLVRYDRSYRLVMFESTRCSRKVNTNESDARLFHTLTISKMINV